MSRNCVLCGKSEFETSYAKTIYASIPSDENRCRDGPSNVGKPELVFLPIDQVDFNKYVCESHFIKNDTDEGRLENSAIGYEQEHNSQSNEQIFEFPIHLWNEKGTNNYSKILNYIEQDHCYGKTQFVEQSTESHTFKNESNLQEDKNSNKHYEPIKKAIAKTYNSKILEIKNDDHKEATTKNENNVILYNINLTSLEFGDDIDIFDDFNDRYYVKNELITTVVGKLPDRPKTIKENFVLHQKGFLKDKLKSVLYSHRFCAVCFESNKVLKSLDEELTIISDNWTQTILLKHVYTYVFKQTETSASGYICTECTTQLQQAYIFIKYSQLTSSLLNEYIDDAQSKIDLFNSMSKGKDNKPINTMFILQSHEVNKYLVDQQEVKENTATYPSVEQNTSKCDQIEKGNLWDEEIQYAEPNQCENETPNEWMALNSQLSHIIKKHLKTAPIKTPRTKKVCEFCSKKCFKLFFHYANDHFKVQCKFCKILVDEDLLKNHLMKEHADDVYLCNICDNPFYTLNRIQIHARIMHDIQDKLAINKLIGMPKQVLKASQINDVGYISGCPDCSDVPCIHRKYIDTYIEQTLNHTFALAKCADCDFACRTKAALVRHANVEHLKHYPHICDQCGSQFYCKEKLKLHITACHQTKNVYICKYCDEQFKSSDIVSNHETSCSSIERAYRCEHCTASFNTNKLLQKHHKRRHKEVFPCQYCNKEWLTEPMRNRHIARVHSGVRIPTKCKFKFVCDICQEEFNSKSKLKKHINDHGPDVKYQCKICNTEYDSLNKLKAHNNTSRHHMPSVVCNICGKQIKQVLLEQHLEEHKLDAEVSCNVCNRRYDNIARLRTHMNNHLNPRKKKKPYRPQLKCKSCDFVASYYGALDIHVNMKHLQIKPFACHLCDRKFYGKSMLTKHMDIWHRPRNKYPCPICGKEYYYKKDLNKHLEALHADKSYACGMCKEKFISSFKRDIHVQRKHTDKSECCPLCSKKFSVVTDLRRHIIVLHWKDKNKHKNANKFDPREVKGLENHYHLFPRWMERQNESSSKP